MHSIAATLLTVRSTVTAILMLLTKTGYVRPGGAGVLLDELMKALPRVEFVTPHTPRMATVIASAAISTSAPLELAATYARSRMATFIASTAISMSAPPEVTTTYTAFHFIMQVSFF